MGATQLRLLQGVLFQTRASTSWRAGRQDDGFP
ncbi:unnamed protein product [Linum tenue]|uniref:Uncharacterized protein n=1 Tax=Linum tenue TaxID=586396 RepID=A0AAV0P0M9_9ROSI|nr:unnamed protein product [Linum tenue]CAI0464271.1 unnamed protein product [Linum tenue]